MRRTGQFRLALAWAGGVGLLAVAVWAADGVPALHGLLFGIDIPVFVVISGGVFAGAVVLIVADGHARLAERHRQRERAEFEARIERLTSSDALTGLVGRDGFAQSIEQALAQAHGRNLTVLSLDLDRFRWINESLGYGSGDAVLREIAQRLVANVRHNDLVARMGSDEFLVLLAAPSPIEDVLAVVRRLLDAVDLPLTVAGRELIVTGRIGVAMHPRDGDSAEALIRNAHIAAGYARHPGSGSFRFFRPEMSPHGADRVDLERGLRNALDRGEFELHYQPKVELKGGTVIGAEALIRWRHPERGLVSPGEFIPVAEQTGLIVPIGEWAIQSACGQIRRWRDAWLPEISVAVNVSPHQMRQGIVADVVAGALHANRLPARCLDLELTETAAMADPEGSIAVLRELKDIGIGIALDDFGTGYSSLSYLNRFPIDCLKIDRSFVNRIASESDDASIARTVITLAHDLGMKAVAEGVETESQLRYLQQRGCDEMQGYLFSRPVPPVEFEEVLRNGRRLTLPAA